MEAKRGRRWPLPPALALFLFLASLYTLTGGGHTYSYDEETMLALTESLVERQSIVIPTCSGCPILRASPLIDQVNYSRYGPFQSLVAVPFYVAGRIVAGDDSAARWFLTRFAVSLLNAAITAGIATLLFRFARDLGYGTRPALATGLLYGLGTQAWPHAKTFFSEPLTTLLLLGAVYCWWRLDRIRTQDRTERYASWWAAGIGAGCGLAVATKVAAGIALPVLALASAWTLWRLSTRPAGSPHSALGAQLPSWRTLRAGLGATSALVVLLALLGLYNHVRFGSPFETGYSVREVVTIQEGDFWAGLRGLLLSPGKSIFIFSPVVALALPAWLPFARRHKALALVSGGLIALHLLFYARVPYWHGDVAWGPRYLDFVLPLLLLPCAAGVAWLSRQALVARRAIVAIAVIVVSLALVVQLLGVLVNFNTGFNTVITGQRHFDWPNSPPLVHAQILRDRTMAWSETRFPREDSVTPEVGFVVVNERDPLWPRFLPREAELRVRVDGNGPVTGAIVYQDARERRDPPQRLTILVDDQPVASQTEAPAFDAPEPAAYRITFPIRAAGDDDEHRIVTIRNDSYAELGPSRLLEFSVVAGDREFPARRRPLILPFPADTPERFAWFLTDRNQHLFDLWLWYVAVLKLPSDFTRLLYAGVGGGALLGLSAGLLGLVRAGRSSSQGSI